MSKRKGPPKVSGLVQSGRLGAVDQEVLDRMPSFDGDDEPTAEPKVLELPTDVDQASSTTRISSPPAVVASPNTTPNLLPTPPITIKPVEVRPDSRLLSQTTDQDKPAPEPSVASIPSGLPDRVVITVALTLIDESPYQNRAQRDDNYIADLAENIRSDGLNDLPSVRLKLGGRYELLTGSNRTAAVRLLGWSEVDVEVRNVDDNKAARLVFFDNYFHKPLQDYEVYLGFAQLMAVGEANGAPPTQRSLAKEAGISTAQMTRLLSFGKLPKAVRDVLDLHPSILQSNAAESLVRFCGIEHEHLVVDAIDQLRDKKLTQGRAASWIEHRLTARPTKSERTLTSKDGKQFAKLARTGRRITVNISAGVDFETIESAVFELLREHAEKGEAT